MSLFRMKGIILLISFLMGNGSAYLSDYVCESQRCNSYVQSRICDLDKVDEIRDTFISNETDIYFGVIEALTQSVSINVQIVQVSALCAIDQINGNPDILQNTTIHPIFIDDRVGKGFSAGLCLGEANIPIAVGTTNSDIAMNTASVFGNVYNRNLVSIYATSSLLSDDDKYKYFSRIRRSDSFLGKAFANICHSFGWRKAVALYSDSNAYSLGIVSSFSDEGRKLGITTVFKTTIPLTPTTEDIKLALETLYNTGVRILVMPIYLSTTVKEIFRIAHEMGYTGSKDPFQMFIISLSNAIHSPYISDGVFAISDLFGATPDNNEAFYNLTQCWRESLLVNDVESKYYGLFHEKVTTRDNPGFFGASAWDAVMVAAKAIHEVGIENAFNPDKISNAINQLDFIGATGRLKMNTHGDREGATYAVLNLQQSKKVIVGTFDEVVKMNPLETVVFIGNTTTVPKDFHMECIPQIHYATNVTECNDGIRYLLHKQASTQSEEYCPDIAPIRVLCDYPSSSSSKAPIAIVIFGLFIDLLVFLGVLHWWNDPIIKLGQRVWLLVLLCGAFVTQLTPLLILGKPSTFTCVVTSFIPTTGFILQFGTLIVKSWKIKKIVASSIRLKRIFISNRQLLYHLFLMLFAGYFFLINMYITDIPRPETIMELMSGQYGNHYEVPVYRCTVKETLWSSGILLYLSSLLLYGCKLSYEIRKSLSLFSDSWFIFLAIYNSAICAFVAFGIIFWVEVNPITQYAIISVAISIACTGNICFLFIPKFVQIATENPNSSSDSFRNSNKVVDNTARSSIRRSTQSLNFDASGIFPIDQEHLVQKVRKLQDENVQLRQDIQEHIKNHAVQLAMMKQQHSKQNNIVELEDDRSRHEVQNGISQHNLESPELPNLV